MSLDAALGSLVVPAAAQSKLRRPTSTPRRRSTAAAAAAGDKLGGGGNSSRVGRNASSAAASPRRGGDHVDADGIKPVTPEVAAALASEALAAVKASLALAQYRHETEGAVVAAAAAAGGSTSAIVGPPLTATHRNGGARELRVALARAIGALRNACVGAASSTAELLGGEDPTGFAQVQQSVRASSPPIYSGYPSTPFGT